MPNFSHAKTDSRRGRPPQMKGLKMKTPKAPKKAPRKPSAAKSAGTNLEFETIQPTESSVREASMDSTQDSKTDSEKVHVAFYGSDLLRMRFPQGMELVDQVATDWVKDASFDDLPIQKPVVKLFVKQGLRKAKDLEKTLEVTGVLPKVRSQVSKVVSLLQNYRR